MTARLVIDLSPEEETLARRLIAETGVAEGAVFMARPEVLRAIGQARRAGAQLARHEEEAAFDPQCRFCRICGCGELTACVIDDVPCHWAAPGLCSACAPYVEGGRG